jgi:DnaJ like chaperone protein
VLGLSAGASSQEIHEAYRRLAHQYHPDKVSHLGEEFQELARQRFLEIQEAYEALTGKTP